MMRTWMTAAYALSLIAFLWLGIPGGAHAQSSDENENVLEEIVVVGSRIARRDFVSPSPIATIDRDAVLNSDQATLE